MESPLLSKNGHIVGVTINDDSSSNYDEHTVNMTANADSSSTDQQTPHEAEGVGSVWMYVEFVLTLVQIVAAIVIIVIRTKDEHQEATLIIWIIGYTCACIATLPVLCWQLWHYNPTFSSDTRIDDVMDCMKVLLEFFFVGWFGVFFWVFVINSSSLEDISQHLWLCMPFVAFSVIRYFRRVITFAAFLLLCAVLLWIDSYNPQTLLMAGLVACLLKLISCLVYGLFGGDGRSGILE